MDRGKRMKAGASAVEIFGRWLEHFGTDVTGWRGLTSADKLEWLVAESFEAAIRAGMDPKEHDEELTEWREEVERMVAELVYAVLVRVSDDA